MACRDWLSRAGNVFLIDDSATATAFSQLLRSSKTQVSITWVNPTSLPPTVMLTSVVRALSADNWLARTVAVVAPAQATETNEAGWWRRAHSCGNALVLRSQLRPAAGYRPAPVPAE